MASETNPIYYKDLVSPDNSITDLIKQLDELSDAYMNTLKNIKGEAIQLTATLKSVSGATEEGRQVTRKASDDAEKLARAYRETAFAESETAKKIAELKQATREANELNKLNVKLAQSAEGSYNKLSAQYSINKIYLNNMTRAEREQTEEGKKLVKQTAAIYEEMKRLQEVTGKHQLNVGNYGDFGKQMEVVSGGISGYQDKITSALGLNNKFGQSLLQLSQSGGGVKTAFLAMGDGVKALGASMLTLMANPVFLAIAGVAAAGAAFKWWYDYNAGLAEATRLTKEFTGLAGDELISVRNEIQACADVMGHDFKETLSTVDALMANYGISAQQALQVVEDGIASGADLSGDMLDKIQKYSSIFHDAGIEASEMVAILSQTRSGIFSDKGLEVITMASKKIREMNTATQEALANLGINVKQVQRDIATGARSTFDVIQEISAKMKNFGADSMQVGRVLKDVFGRNGADAGIKLIEQLDTMTTDIEKAKEQTGEWGEAQKEQIKATAELNNAMSALFDVTDKGFESAIDQIKLMATKWLTAAVKGCIDLVNWFVQMYNKSLAVRLGVQGVIAQFKALWEVFKLMSNFTIDVYKNFGRMFDAFISTVKSGFKSIIGVMSGFGKTMEGIAKFDFTRVKEGVDEIKSSVTSGFKNALTNFGSAIKASAKEVTGDVMTAGKGIGKAFVEAFNTATSGEKLNVLEMPKNMGDGEAKGDTRTNATYTEYQDGKKKDLSKEAEKARQAAERAYQARLAAKRKAEDAELDLLEDGYNKERKRTEYYYTRQVEDLQHSLTLLKSTEVKQREDITNTIISLKEKQSQVLAEMERKHEDDMLKLQAEAIRLRLEAVAKGSEQERQLKMEQIEIERKQALRENATKPKDMQQDTNDINSKFNAKRMGVADEVIKAQMAIFDQQQALADSEFALLKNSEERKTRFRLQAEKARLQKIIELNKEAGTKLTDVELATIQNTILKIDQEIEQSRKDEGSRDLYGLLGLNLTDDQKEAIDNSLAFAMEALNTWTAAQVAAAEADVKRANQRAENAQRVLDAEREARANGYASNVAYAQKELDLAKRNQEKAIKEQQKAQKQQAAIQALQQIGNLITATTTIWSQLGFPWAIPAIAVMWGSFAMAKIKASQATKQSETYGEGTVELLDGGSHQSGNDVDLGTKKDGTRRRAEGGEFFAVINKRNSKRYRHVIPDVIKALNNGTFEDKYSNAFAGNGVGVTVTEASPDLDELNDNVRSIREQSERKTYHDAQGNTIVQYKNLTRKIKTT